MKPIVLCILDGWGYREETRGNGVALANTPNFDRLWNEYPHTTIHAAEEHVGLPSGQMGNSEVGHLNLGAGRVVYQDLMRINRSINDGTFYQNEAFLKAIDNAKKNKSNIHLCGLVSDGGVHSHIDHLFAILELCKKESFENVYIHVLLDGRDTSALGNERYVEELKKKITEIGVGEIITIGGRYYMMNRDRSWELTGLAFECIFNGQAQVASSTEESFELEYSENLTDEFMKPTVIKSVPINDNDSLIFFNFRSDRMIQPLTLLNDKNQKYYNIKRTISPFVVTMTEYDKADYNKDIVIAFEKLVHKNTIGAVMEQNGLKQFRMSEHEKRGHVTFYYSGANDSLFKGEDRYIFDKVDTFTYDEYPPMKANDITDKLIDLINSKEYGLIVVNYPNPDCLGHTGVLEAVIEGLEHLDVCLGKLISKTSFKDYTLFITADHGDAEYMINEDGTPNKSHTTNVVPLIVCEKNLTLKEGKLADIAPTMLHMMEIEIPDEMTGDVLVK